jgi:hypothetical protein
MAQLRAFAICPTCSELYPSFRGCPACDGVPIADAAPAVAAAPEPRFIDSHLGETLAETANRDAGTRSMGAYVAALSVGVMVVCGLLVALLNH